LGFIFLGALWLGIFCVRNERTPAYAVGFALAPAVLVSIDRFTIDVALAALCVGFAIARGWRLFLVLALAPLARETGIVLPLAVGLGAVLLKDRRTLALACGAVVPYGIWLAYLARRTSPDQTAFTSLVPFQGLVERTLHPVQGALFSPWLRTAAALD